jgi:hypothetical protein
MLSLSQAGKAWGLVDDAPEFQNRESETSEPKVAPTTVNYIFPTINAVMFQRTSRTQDGCSGEDLKISEGSSSAAENQPTEANHDQRNDYRVVWSAGVSASGAGLAALFNGQAPWQRAIFISLIFISACTFVILILVGLPRVMSRRRRLRRTSPGVDNSGRPESD